jgi:8-oxo-dGTP diphosphatase
MAIHMEKNRPRVGIGVLIIKNGKVLMGRRKNAHGDGDWSPTGGHLEFGESFEHCAKREALEEAGVKIRNVRFATITNDVFEKENLHYITIIMLADYDSGEPKLLEPDKFTEWGWFSWNSMPQPLFLPIRNLLKSGFSPFSAR